MSKSYNRVVLIGNLTRDVEVKYLQSGMAVSEVTLAVNDRRKNQQGEWVDEVSFIDVTLWARNAEVASEYLTKGSPVFIEGRLKLDQWETDGQKRSKLRVVAENLVLIGGRGGSGGGGGDAGEGRGEGRGESRGGGARSTGRSGGGYNRGGGDDAPAPSRSSGPPPMDHGDDDIPF
jgi:single-strand DNA-binding protein